MPLSFRLVCCLPCSCPVGASAAEYDVVVYGGTSAGVIAAVQARKMGKSVVLVGPDPHLGGLSSGGLGFTDTGDKSVIGGLSRDFYHRIWKHYDQDANWTLAEEVGVRQQGPGHAGHRRRRSARCGSSSRTPQKGPSTRS